MRTTLFLPTVPLRRAQFLLIPLMLSLLVGCEPKVPEREEVLPDATPGTGVVSAEANPTPAATPSPTPTPAPTPLPQVYIPFQQLDTSRLWSGISLNASSSTEPGRVASVERKDPQSYTINVDVKVRVPEPASTLDELAAVNPQLPTVLPGLSGMMSTAKVSDFYHAIYDLKVRYIQDRLKRLDRLVSMHNFYDTETILEMQHPETGRKLLLLQAEMDVVTDGSDADRQGEVDASSSSFQPFTSYKWRKRTDKPNPFLASRQERLAEFEKEFAVPGLSITRNRELREGIEQMKREIIELQNYSFLVSKTDPFIVLPGFMRRQVGHEYRPQLGDYAAVIYGDTIYPAIFGDVGPSYKAGEASFRICTEIEPRTSGIRRAVNDLVVTYLVFPGTAESSAGPPDVDQYIKRVTELIGEIGGHGGTVREWEDLYAKPDGVEQEAPASPAAPADGELPIEEFEKAERESE